MAYKLRDRNVVTIVATSDMDAFSYVTMGSRVGIALTEAKTGERVAIDFTGVWLLEADTSKTYAYGDTIRLVGGVAVNDGADSDPHIGMCVSEKAAGVAGAIEVAFGA